jgi:hypothetical protein
MATRIPLAVCFVFGVIMFLQYFSGHPIAKGAYNTILDWWQIIFAFTLFVGAAAFVKVNLKNISRGKETIYRIIAMGGVILMPILAIIGGTKIDSPFMGF